MIRSERRAGPHTGDPERIKTESTTPIAKVIELIGNSQENFEDAIDRAIGTAARSVRNISAAEVRRFSAIVPNGQVVEYRVDLKVAFGVEAEGTGGV